MSLSTQISALLGTGEPLRWLFYGDSITHGSVLTYGWRDYTQHFVERLRTEINGRHLVLNSAVSGQTSRDLVEDFQWRAQNFAPHVAFLMIGMNDCARSRAISPDEFGANLNILADRFAEVGSLLVLQTANPIWHNVAAEMTEDRARLPLYMEAVRRVAQTRGLPLVDHGAYWEGQIAQNPRRGWVWMADPIHPGEQGHRAFAELLIRECGLWDENSVTCRFLGARN